MKQLILIIALTIGAAGGQYYGYRLGYAEASAGIKDLDRSGMTDRVPIADFIDLPTKRLAQY